MDNPYQAPSANLNTSAHHEALKYVGFWARTGAYLIDTLIMFIIILPIFVLTADSFDEFASEAEAPSIGMTILLYLLPIIMIMGFWIWKGSTPGKMVFKAKIVDARTGGKPSIMQFIVRYIGYFLSSLPVFLGFLWIGWDKRKQGWHDKLSKTVVVRPSDHLEQGYLKKPYENR